MKNIIKFTVVAFAIFAVSALSASIMKESAVKVEVDNAKEALNELDSKADLAKFIPYKKAFFARTYYYKADKMLKESEYDKASFYAVLSMNYSKQSVAIASAFKVEYDRMAAAMAAMKLDKTGDSLALAQAGFKRKGKSSIFTATLDLKLLFNEKRAPSVDNLQGLTEEAKSRLLSVATVLDNQKNVKITLNSTGKNEEIANAYANKIKDLLIENKIDQGRIEVQAKKGRKDLVDVTLDGVSAK